MSERKPTVLLALSPLVEQQIAGLLFGQEATVTVAASLVELARHKLGGERWQRPRTLDVLGLAGLDVQGIRAFVERGRTPATARTVVAASLPVEHLGSRLELIPQV